MHYQSRAERDALVSIDADVYRNLLKTKTGNDLAVAVSEAFTVLDDDPRQSALDDTEVFFSYNDVTDGFVKPAELLQELDDAQQAG